MRLFITSYQKSGTHQIMPSFDVQQDIVDRSRNQLLDLPERYGRIGELDYDGIKETSIRLSNFHWKAFGHVSYLPIYAKALQEIEPTKVLFNVRDPRDVVISEYYSSAYGEWPNLHIPEYKCSIAELEDPILELIRVAAVRWPKWLGWLQHDFVRKVKYEDLRLNGIEEIPKIVEWLKPYEVNAVECVARLKPRPLNPTFRRGVPGEWKTGMSDEQKELSKELLGDIITELGYEV